MAKSKKTDPYAEREAAKYTLPIPSREFILEYLEERGRPASRNDLIQELDLKTELEQEALKRRLRAMERDGQLVFTRKGGYGVAAQMGLVTGRVIGHKDGYGFLVTEDSGEDVYLNAKQMRAVFDGDRVLVRISYLDKRGRREGDVVEVLERANTEIIGRYFFDKGVGFVVPENKRINQDIIIPQIHHKDAQHGQIVVVEILAPPTKRTQAVGRVKEILGEYMAPGMEIEVAIRAYDLPHKWSAAALAEAESYRDGIADIETKNRKDLRNKAFVTIDGEDAKDFDDAVYCEVKSKGGWILYVAIADVSYYVPPESATDQEALLRGNSVYFPGRVVPMLPYQLSNELCSLKPKQDRLTMVCEMSISPKGKVTRYRFYEAIIHSHARMTYTNVYKILVKKDVKLRKQFAALTQDFENLYGLYKVLNQQRQIRGALEFDTLETQVVFDKMGKIEKILPRVRNDAHKLIEEFMLLANVSASKFLAKHQIPSLYRVHEGPKNDKLMDLKSFLIELGLVLKGGENPKPKDYAEILEKVEGRPDANMIQMVMLRSLSQAVYTPENKGHFGLAYDCYAHFTSPIRRYADLLVHRAIKHLLYNKNVLHFRYSYNDMIKFGEHCSLTERRADDATREVLDYLKCEFMQSKVGEVYDAIIIGVTSFGVFAQLKEFFVEGLVHISELPEDYYQFDSKRHRLTGRRSGHHYSLTDEIKVQVARVDVEQKQIDFILADIPSS